MYQVVISSGSAELLLWWTYRQTTSLGQKSWQLSVLLSWSHCTFPKATWSIRSPALHTAEAKLRIYRKTWHQTFPFQLLQALETGATFAKFVTKEQRYLSGSLQVWSSPVQQLAFPTYCSREQHDPFAQEWCLRVCLNSLIIRALWNLKRLPTHMQWVCWNMLGGASGRYETGQMSHWTPFLSSAEGHCWAFLLGTSWNRPQ